MRISVVSLATLALAVLTSTLQAIPDDLPEISMSASLLLDAISSASNGSHATQTVKCNDKEVKNLTKIECQGNFEIEDKKGHSTLRVQCHGKVKITNKDQKSTANCDGKYVFVYVQSTKGKNHTKEESHHTLKCSDQYHMHRFTTGDALLNETCVGMLDKIDRHVTVTQNELQNTKCVAKCDGVEVELKSAYPCSGAYSQVCKSSSGSEKKEVCDGTFRGNHGTSCRGSYELTMSDKVNTVMQKCDSYFSSVQKHKHDLRQKLEHCAGYYSYVTVKTGSKPHELLLE